MKQKYLFILLSCIFLAACSSGKKKMEQGDYDTAVYKAVKRLQQKPNHKKASKVLREAYTLAVDQHMSAIEYLDKSNRAFKYDAMVDEYRQVRMLNQAILRYPKYAKLVSLVNVDDEISFTQQQASKVHFAEAESLMNKGTKAHARDAFYHYSRASYFTPGKSELYDKMDEALEAGTVHVGIEFATTRRFSRDFNTELIFSQLFQGLANNTAYRFLNIVDATSTDLLLDELVFVDLEEAYVGDVYVDRNQTTVSKEDVLMGEAQTDSGEVVKVYGTVTADYIEFKKSIRSNASILVELVDPHSESVISSRLIPNSFFWTERWATYRGDKRALTEDQYRLATSTEPRAPDFNWIFAQTSAPLAGEACNFIRNQYSYLR